MYYIIQKDIWNWYQHKIYRDVISGISAKYKAIKGVPDRILQHSCLCATELRSWAKERQTDWSLSKNTSKEFIFKLNFESLAFWYLSSLFPFFYQSIYFRDLRFSLTFLYLLRSNRLPYIANFFVLLLL